MKVREENKKRKKKMKKMMMRVMRNELLKIITITIYKMITEH